MLCAAVPVELVLLDRECPASQVARDHGVGVNIVERSGFGADFDRESFTVEVTRVLEDAEIELVVMAGFGTILDQAIYDRYEGHVLNTHPSLLPSFPGWHAVAAALEHGVKLTGCTVHVATREVDAGPILAQEPVRVIEGDTAETLQERIKVIERRLYVDIVQDIVDRGYV